MKAFSARNYSLQFEQVIFYVLQLVKKKIQYLRLKYRKGALANKKKFYLEILKGKKGKKEKLLYTCLNKNPIKCGLFHKLFLRINTNKI